MIVVVDADRDLLEMKEAFTRQENIVMGRGLFKHKTEVEENIAPSISFKRVAVDVIDGRRKVTILERGQI